MTQAKRQQVSAPSQLLSNEENAMVVKILGPRCPSLATTVVQIYMSDSASGNLYMILYYINPSPNMILLVKNHVMQVLYKIFYSMINSCHTRF